MSRNEEEGPVYYREIQKNGYLKRIPYDTGGSKLRPLGHKKPALKPMWTLFCVHNGRTPYLEQYPSPESPCALSHKPLWRASLRAARHVTASVKPHVGSEHDFLIHTDSGGVRMLAPDWESMHAWVRCLRLKLLELRVLSPGENVYCAPPAPPAAAPSPPPPRLASRDPTSPLPPTPRVPPDRVPGIELNTPRPTPIPEVTEQPETTTDPPEATTEPAIDSQSRIPIDNSQSRSIENSHSRIAIENSQSRIDISDWESTLNINSMPSTSQEKAKCEPQKSVAKICGQNICLDDSIFKRSEVTESDEEFCNEILDAVESQSIDCQAEVVEMSDMVEDYTQRLTVNSDGKITETSNGSSEEPHNSGPPSNVTVIVVCNKPAETAGSDVTRVPTSQENGYGAVFSTEPAYGHISLTTSVNLTQDGLYERLCMATSSTLRETPSPLPVRRLQTTDKMRKCSLPNLDTEPSSSHANDNSTYEFLFSEDNQTNINVGGVNVVKVNRVGRHVNSVTVGANDSPIVREGRVERSHSQNACDSTRFRERLIRREGSPKREKVDKPDAPQSKPIWKRGLTELSLLSRLRGIAQAKRPESPTRQDPADRNVSSVVVVHRSRAEARPDGGRRRSTSLSNGTTAAPHPAGALPTLRVREAAWLLAEQTLTARVAAARPPLLFTYDTHLWVACWYRGARHGGRAGDRVLGVRGAAPRDLAHARALMKQQPQHKIDIVYNRVPLAKIYVLNKDTEDENIGITLDSECAISGVTSGSPCARAGLPPPGHWAVTEVNNRPLNLVKGAQADVARLSACGKEVSVLLQPAPLVRKLRQALKQNRSLLALR